MKIQVYHITLLLFLSLFGCQQNSTKEKVKIPKHSVFVPERVEFPTYDENYIEKTD